MQFFEAVPLDAFSDEVNARLFACELLLRLTKQTVDNSLFDIDLECDSVACACSRHLRPWRAGWSTMPRRR
jgi:hypothetical protein